MKRFLILISLCFLSVLGYSQERRLFIADEYNGNYLSIDIGTDLHLLLKDSISLIDGRLSGINTNSILFTDVTNRTIQIPIDNIASIVKSGKVNTPGNLVFNGLKYVAGTFIGLYGAVAIIGGLVVVSQSGPEGVAFIMLGGLLSAGAYGLYNSASKGLSAKNKVRTYVLDGVYYRIIIK